MQRKITHSLRLIAEALEKYPKIVVACSFGKDSIVTVHLCRRINPNIEVFSVITPYKFKETLDYKDKMENLWNLNLKTYGDRSFPTYLDEEYAPSNPEKCCDYFKVQPTKEAVKNLDAWISGLRGTEGHTREFIDEVENRDGLIKINPILSWTEAEIWLYHAFNNIPVHPLYMQGYRSLGCKPCSEPYTEKERSGRWQGTEKCGGECGIHSQSLVDYFEKDKIGEVKQDVYGVPKRKCKNR